MLFSGRVIVGSNDARTCWVHLTTEVFNWFAPAPVSSTEHESTVKLRIHNNFIHSFRFLVIIVRNYSESKK